MRPEFVALFASEEYEEVVCSTSAMDTQMDTGWFGRPILQRERGPGCTESQRDRGCVRGSDPDRG